MNFMPGITYRDWKNLVKENKFSIDSKNYGIALRITLSSLANSRMKKKENKIYADKIAETEILDPIFILGHWRSGTTLIHKLLSLDEQFAYPNLFQVTHPHSFLFREESVKKILENRQGEERPMDNMKVTYKDPGEDESAISVMSQRSPLVGWGFPDQQPHYAKYHTFDSVKSEDFERWKDSFLWFCKKLTYRYGKPLVLKSPIHTARVKILLKLFPNAKFIHVYRNPYTVFNSTKRLYSKMLPTTSLQKFDLKDWDNYIIENYKIIYSAYLQDRELIPKQNLIEFSFEEFENNKLNYISKIYEKFSLPGFDQIVSIFDDHLNSIKNYKKNIFREIDSLNKDKIIENWDFTFREFGYDV